MEIYYHLFHSTRLSFGWLHVEVADGWELVRLRPAPSSLSLLRVCSRITDEIGYSWLGQVLFSFEDVKTMLDKLTSLKPHILGKLRHMRYSERRLTHEFPAQRTSSIQYQCGLTHMLKLLPGLCLETLTVLGHHNRQARYIELQEMINCSSGWKELRYLSWNSAMLSYSEYDEYWRRNLNFLRSPQPSSWDLSLRSRDGPTASVNIYRSSQEAEYGSMLSRPESREIFPGQVEEAGKRYGVEGDAALMAPSQKDKEILVVARRGEGVDYAEKLGSPMLLYDIRLRWPGMTWEQIRSNHLDPRPHYSDGTAGPGTDEIGCPIKIDTYKNVEDYAWSPFHTYSNPW